MSLPGLFVSIACFSDPDLLDTVYDALTKASHPERIAFGICLQADHDDRRYDIFDQYDPIRVDRISILEAKGPIYARSRCESLLENEEYFLQIDCHSRFFCGWDEILIDELERAELINPSCVLTHYPVNIKNMDNPEFLDRIGHVNRYRHVGEDAIKSHGSLVSLPSEPLPSLGVSAAMLFMRSGLRRAFPYDPELHFGLHAAEQVLYSVRLWTHGVELFCPTRHALATDYAGSRNRISAQARQLMAERRQNWPEATWTKVKYLLGLDSEQQVDAFYRDSLPSVLQSYGLGTIRSLLDYYRFAGIHSDLKQVFPNYRYRHELD